MWGPGLLVMVADTDAGNVALQQQEYPGVLASWEDSGIAHIFGCGSSQIASSETVDAQ